MNWWKRNSSAAWVKKYFCCKMPLMRLFWFCSSQVVRLIYINIMIYVYWTKQEIIEYLLLSRKGKQKNKNYFKTITGFLVVYSDRQAQWNWPWLQLLGHKHMQASDSHFFLLEMKRKMKFFIILQKHMSTSNTCTLHIYRRPVSQPASHCS